MNINWKCVFEKIIVGIMDCLEECMRTMTIVAGKKLINVFLSTLCFLAFSVIALILKLPVFATWQESLTASVIMGAICGMSYINKVNINTILKKLRSRKGDLQNERK